MICDTGGAQTRSLREVYHFIKAQYIFLTKQQCKNIYMINILDGNGCFKYVHLFRRFEHDQLFIGDMSSFCSWFKR